MRRRAQFSSWDPLLPALFVLASFFARARALATHHLRARARMHYAYMPLHCTALSSLYAVQHGGTGEKREEEASRKKCARSPKNVSRKSSRDAHGSHEKFSIFLFFLFRNEVVQFADEMELLGGFCPVRGALLRMAGLANMFRCLSARGNCFYVYSVKLVYFCERCVFAQTCHMPVWSNYVIFLRPLSCWVNITTAK